MWKYNYLISLKKWWIFRFFLSSVAQSCLTLCDPMDCSVPSPNPGVYSSSCPLSRWCHPTSSSSVVPFSSCLQSFPASGSFPVSQFTSGGQNMRVSASASVLLMTIQDWFPLGFSSIQSLSNVRLFATPWTAAHKASLSITNSWSLLKLKSIELVMPSNQLILCCPLLLSPSIFPSIRVFSNESVLRIRWPKYWCFSFSISPSKEYSGLISFRIDWFYLPEVQGILKSLHQHHNSKENSSVLSFLYSPLLHPYMTTGKTIALTRQTFVGKVMSLLFNMLFRLVIAFLPRSKCLLISWLQ